MKDLLALKEQFKTLTGTDYKPSNTVVQKENQKEASTASSTNADALAESIAQQGEKVRELKANKSASKVSPKISDLYRQNIAQTRVGV